MASSREQGFPLMAVEREQSSTALRLHPATARRWRLAAGSSVDVVCSDRSATVGVELSNRVREDAIVLPTATLRPLGLASPASTRLRFRVKHVGRRLELGPVVGILAHVNAREKPSPRDHGYEIIQTVWNIENLGGLVYFFSPGDIHWDTRTVRGFVHVPGKVDWEAGEFPFPKAVYRRIAISRTLGEKLKRDMTPHMFNPVALGNKLVQFQLLSQDSALRKHLPETRPLKSEADFHAVVRRHGRAYVKNTDKGAGAGVFLVRPRTRGGFRVRLHAKDPKRKSRDRTIVVSDFRRLMHEATAKVGRPWRADHWLVQQPIALAQYRGRPFDVRVNVQKDGFGRWWIAGHVVRIAPDKRSAVTRRGEYRSPQPVLKQIWPRRVRSIIREMNAVSVEACRLLEKKLGLMGDVGVDIALDEEARPWFIEANPRPSHALRTTDRLGPTFWAKVFNPLVYASHLAGFSLGPDDIAWPKNKS